MDQGRYDEAESLLVSSYSTLRTGSVADTAGSPRLANACAAFMRQRAAPSKPYSSATTTEQRRPQEENV